MLSLLLLEAETHLISCRFLVSDQCHTQSCTVVPLDFVLVTLNHDHILCGNRVNFANKLLKSYFYNIFNKTTFFETFGSGSSSI